MKHWLFSVFDRALHRFAFRLQRFPLAMQGYPSRELHLSLEHVIALHQALRRDRTEPFVLLQIGAYPTEDNDPLRIVSGARRAILVEPQPQFCNALRARHRHDPSIDVVQAAVSPSEGRKPFFVVDNEDGALPAWTHQLASFDRKHIEKFEKQVPGISGRIRETAVDAVSFASLARRFGIDRLDLLMLDSEGYDLELLKDFPFTDLQPSIVYYEHIHLRRRDRESSVALLISHGYRVQFLERDAVAVKD